MILESLIERFGVQDGELRVGGIPLGRLAARVGSSPFFAYDRGLLSSRVAEVRKALPPAVQLSYAVKANPMPAVVGHLTAEVDKMDVASAGELKIALDAGMPGHALSFAGPGKTETEVRQAVAAGVTLEVESQTEARRMIAAGEALGIRPRAAIRVNPDFAVKGSGMRLGGGPQQFGVDSEQVPALLRDLGAADVDVVGFHVFAGSQNLRADIIVEAQHKTVDLLCRLAEHAPGEVTYVNLGGGFGIPYSERDSPLDLAAISEGMVAVVEDLRQSLPLAGPVIELGRYLVGECGVYVTSILDKKTSRGREYLVVDGGMHHQLAASGNFGQVIRRNYPIAIGTRLDQEPAGPVTVVGSLCTPLDLLGDQVPLPATEIGDLVVIFQAGAYGLTASPTRFLGHPEPVEVLV